VSIIKISSILMLFILVACASVPPVTPAPRDPPKKEEIERLEAEDPTWKLLQIVNPIYPRKPFYDGIEGWVVLEYDVYEDGVPRNIKVKDSSPKDLFDSAAIKALEQFLYEPIKKGGESEVKPLIGLNRLFHFKIQRKP